MAGTLEISDELCWMPAGWIYDAVLERLSTAVMARDPLLSEILLRSTTESNGGYLDVRPFDSDQVAVLTSAAETEFARLVSEGANSLARPEFHAGLRDQFRSLIEMLQIKGRADTSTAEVASGVNGRSELAPDRAESLT